MKGPWAATRKIQVTMPEIRLWRAAMVDKWTGGWVLADGKLDLGGSKAIMAPGRPLYSKQ
uniref:Uncharacterized protein n=1 Tax=Romanomermis culicivorax TaxID=13658 RepID=A0A915KJN5_ROMCU